VRAGVRAVSRFTGDPLRKRKKKKLGKSARNALRHLSLSTHILTYGLARVWKSGVLECALGFARFRASLAILCGVGWPGASSIQTPGHPTPQRIASEARNRANPSAHSSTPLCEEGSVRAVSRFTGDPLRGGVARRE
jgi:hypothetical protein